VPALLEPLAHDIGGLTAALKDQQPVFLCRDPCFKDIDTGCLIEINKSVDKICSYICQSTPHKNRLNESILLPGVIIGFEPWQTDRQYQVFEKKAPVKGH
jgi:hypothetical protein